MTAAAAWRCSSAATRASSAVMSCCSRATARARGSVRARTLARASSGGSSPSTSAQRLRSAASSPSSATASASSSACAGSAAVSSAATAISAARWAASASRVETTSTSAAASRAATTARPRSRSTPEVPRARSTRPCTRPSARARSSSRCEESSAEVRGGLGVEHLEGGVELALLLVADGQALGGGAAAARQLGQLGAGQVAPDGQQLGGHAVVGAGGGGLALQRADLAPHLAHQVAQALEVLGRAGQPALGPLAATSVLEDAGRLLDDGPAVLGPGVEHGVQLALADDHVLLAPDAGVREQLLDVEQAAGRPVDGVLAVARAEERAGDGHLGQVDGELPRGVVDGQRHLGPAQRGPRRGPGEDDVLHFGRAQRAGALGPEDPGHGVDHVRLAAAVGADHHGDAGLELEHGGVGERLEPLHAERLQEHRGDPSGPERPGLANSGVPPSTCPSGRAGSRAGPARERPVQTWQCSQKKVERPPVLTRTITLRQRRQAWPSRS